jgi:hypothetical protein
VKSSSKKMRKGGVVESGMMKREVGVLVGWKDGGRLLGSRKRR